MLIDFNMFVGSEICRLFLATKYEKMKCFGNIVGLGFSCAGFTALWI